MLACADIRWRMLTYASLLCSARPQSARVLSSMCPPARSVITLRSSLPSALRETSQVCLYISIRQHAQHTSAYAAYASERCASLFPLPCAPPRRYAFADVCAFMLTCAHVCCRMLMYADVCACMLTCPDAPPCRASHFPLHADVCWRMLTHVDVC